VSANLLRAIDQAALNFGGKVLPLLRVKRRTRSDSSYATAFELQGNPGVIPA
jgi:hypothetical protein